MIWTSWKQARKIEQYKPGDTTFKNQNIVNMVTNDPISGVSTGESRLSKKTSEAILLSNWEWENELIETWYHMEYDTDDSSNNPIIYDYDDSVNQPAGYNYDDSSGRFILFSYDDSSEPPMKFNYDDSSGPVKYDCDDSSGRYLWCDNDDKLPTGYDCDDSSSYMDGFDYNDSSNNTDGLDYDDSSGLYSKQMIVIKNIEVKIHISRLSRVKDLTIQLYSCGKLIGENLANPDAEDIHTYGGVIKTWGIKNINPFDVGLVLDYQPHTSMPSSELVYLRKVQMRVAYETELVVLPHQVPDCMSKKIPDIGP